MNSKFLRILGFTSLVLCFCNSDIFAAKHSSCLRDSGEVALSTKNLVQRVLFDFVIKNKNMVYNLSFSPDPSLTERTDAHVGIIGKHVFFACNGYEYIGNSNGELSIVNLQQRSCDRIKVYSRAPVSCITAKDNLVVTGSNGNKFIHRWDISACSHTGKIESERLEMEAPIIFMCILGDLLFVIDVRGNFIGIDWNNFTEVCKFDLGIHNPIVSVTVNSKDNVIIVMTESNNYIVNVDPLVAINYCVKALERAARLEFFMQLIQSGKINLETYVENLELLPNAIVPFV